MVSYRLNVKITSSHNSTMTWVRELESSYTKGHFYIKRLLHSAKECPEIAIDALEAALNAVMSATTDVTLYSEVLTALNQERGSVVAEDKEWILQAQSSYEKDVNTLRQELDSCATKETARFKIKLGQIHARAGALNKALDTFISILASCTPAEKIEATVDICEIYLYRESISLARTTSSRVLASLPKQVMSSKDPALVACIARLKIILAISCVDAGLFEEAFNAVMEEDEPEYFVGQPQGLLYDIAVYIAMIGLTRFSREDLKYLSKKDPVFRAICGKSPDVTTLLTQFLSAQHADFFKTWMDNFSRYKFDLNMGKHYDKFVAQMRQRCLLQEISPHATVSLEHLAHVFGCSAMSIAEELAQLIQEKQLESVRVDWLKQLVVYVPIDPNRRLALKAEELAKQHIRDSSALAWKVQALRLDPK